MCHYNFTIFGKRGGRRPQGQREGGGGRGGDRAPPELSKIFTYNIVHWYVLEYGVDKVVV